jgi:succinate dehydrogenase flavin-adding protein (antitoxin of CptAB toxin-antitoxin module)
MTTATSTGPQRRPTETGAERLLFRARRVAREADERLTRFKNASARVL